MYVSHMPAVKESGPPTRKGHRYSRNLGNTPARLFVDSWLGYPDKHHIRQGPQVREVWQTIFSRLQTRLRLTTE